jgi:hypothetical protein
LFIKPTLLVRLSRIVIETFIELKAWVKPDENSSYRRTCGVMRWIYGAPDILSWNALSKPPLIRSPFFEVDRPILRATYDAIPKEEMVVTPK